MGFSCLLVFLLCRSRVEHDREDGDDDVVFCLSLSLNGLGFFFLLSSPSAVFSCAFRGFSFCTCHLIESHYLVFVVVVCVCVLLFFFVFFVKKFFSPQKKKKKKKKK